MLVEHGHLDVGVALAEQHHGAGDERGVGGREAGQPPAG
jgi:hypothetical protein